MDISKSLVEQIALTQTFILEKVASYHERLKISNQDIRLLTEALVAFDRVLDNNFLEPHDKVLIEKTFRIGNDCTHGRLNYFASYYYSYQNIVKGNLLTQQQAFFGINVETASMLTTILGFPKGLSRIGGSTDDYFIERMPRIFWSLDFVYDKKKTELYLPAMYVLINLMQSLNAYSEINHDNYKAQALDLLQKLNSYLDKFTSVDEITSILKSNIQLDLFYKVQKNKTIQILKLEEDELSTDLNDLPNVKSEHQLRILTSLYFLDPKRFVSLFEKYFDSLTKDIANSKPGLNNLLLLQCLAYYNQIHPVSANLDITLDPIFESKLDLNSHLKDIFQDYENSHAETISQAELDLLLGYNDEVLREKVANVIIGVDKGVLERERKKPHGGFEISDMELRIKLAGENYFLCMPFKSGVEIREKAVPESISYQIFRPFINFNRTVVIFVTAKRCSQNLMNYIKRMQDKLKWDIAVLENEELAKLLKVNGQLN